MTNIYIVKVMNRFDNDRTTNHYFTTKEKAMAYAEKINTAYEKARENKDYENMIYHIDMKWGIKEVVADRD